MGVLISDREPNPNDYMICVKQGHPSHGQVQRNNTFDDKNTTDWKVIEGTVPGSKKVALLVRVSMLTRVVIDADDDDTQLQPQIIDNLTARLRNNEGLENIVEMYPDEEIPYGDLKSEQYSETQRK